MGENVGTYTKSDLLANSASANINKVLSSFLEKYLEVLRTLCPAVISLYGFLQQNQWVIICLCKKHTHILLKICSNFL